MPLTHFYMHAREGGDEAGLEEQPDEQQQQQQQGLQRQGSEERGGSARSRSVTPEPGTGTGTQGDGEEGEGEEGEQGDGRGSPGVRVVDNERLKRRVWGALACGESLELAKAVPYLDEMRRRAVAAGGGELAKAAAEGGGGGGGGADGRAEAEAGGGEGGGGPRGRRVWVYHFSEFRQPPWRMYGTWRAARVVSYVEETGEHEVRTAARFGVERGAWAVLWWRAGRG